MGALLSHLISFSRLDARILLLGLDSAGKTSLLYKLKLNETVATIPTIGFNVETINYKKMKLNMWDVGGQNKLRNLWKHYFPNADALIFMVDASDPDRFQEASEELFKIYMDRESKLKCILILANKSDLPTAQPIEDIIRFFRMNQIKVQWKFQACSAMTGDGIYESLDTLYEMLTKKG